MPTSQVNAAQWQSFEMRMRQRRASRLVIRAQAALEQGLVADAAAALEEACGLDSSTPDLATLMARLPSPAPAADLPLVTEIPFQEPIVGRTVTEPLFDEPIVNRSGHRATGWAAVAASLAILGMLVTWGVTRLSFAPVTPPTSDATAAAPPAPADQPMAATTGHTDAPVPVSNAPAVTAPAVTTPAVTDTPARPVDARDSARHDVDPAPLPASRSSTPPPPATEAPTPPRPEALRAEPLRDLPAAERVSIALPEAAPPPPAPVATPTSDVSVPAPVVAPPAAPEPAEPPRVDDTPLVRRVLSQYESAYSSLDVSAAKRVWPSVDTFALARAFDGLQMQRVSLGDCRVSLNGPTARANCRGSAQWTPKIGSGTRSGSRTWAFDLRKSDGQWRIVDVTMR